MRGNPTGGVNAVPMTSADVKLAQEGFQGLPPKSVALGQGVLSQGRGHVDPACVGQKTPRSMWPQLCDGPHNEEGFIRSAEPFRGLHPSRDQALRIKLIERNRQPPTLGIESRSAL